MANKVFKDLAKEKQLITRRCLEAFCIIVLLVLLFVSRLVYLQIVKHPFYTTLAKQNQIDVVPIEPTRGLIYDRNGVLLAKNIPVFSLDIIPDRVENLDATIANLQKIIPITDGELETFNKVLTQHRRFDDVPLKLKLSEEEVATFSANKYQFPGVVVKARLIREYPNGADSAHVVGYVGRINAQELETIDKGNYSATNYIGKSGIEKQYEDKLHGTVGYKSIEVNASGQEVRSLGITPPIPGENLYLSIDSKLQKVAEKALGKNQGAVIAIDPNTGEILALASMPSFDPNQFVKGISNKDYQALIQNENRPMFNRALRGLYSPGSTVKPFLALQGLDTETVTPETTIFDPGYFKLPHSKHIFHDWKTGGHGNVDVHSAIVDSCDTYFYWLANKMKIANIDIILDQFGFGKTTGIDLPNELKGLVPTPDWKLSEQGLPWYPGDTLNTGIGQGFMLSTPLQLASATATLAMHGDRRTPHLLIASQLAKQPIKNIKKKQLEPVMLIHPESWELVIKAMQDVIQDPQGTGFRFGRDTSYTVAAKTGTAQVSSRKALGEDVPVKLRANGLFIAFAPIDHPQIALAIVVAHTETVAPVVARKVMDYYLNETQGVKSSFDTPSLKTQGVKSSFDPFAGK